MLAKYKQHKPVHSLSYNPIRTDTNYYYCRCCTPLLHYPRCAFFPSRPPVYHDNVFVYRETSRIRPIPVRRSVKTSNIRNVKKSQRRTRQEFVDVPEYSKRPKTENRAITIERFYFLLDRLFSIADVRHYVVIVSSSVNPSAVIYEIRPTVTTQQVPL